MSERLLHALGYRTLEAADGESGIAVMTQTARIDLLMTDMVLPGGMGGVSLAQEAKRCHPEIKVFYMSGYAKDAVGQEGKLDSGSSFLQKPFRKAQLARKVRDVLDRPTP